MPAQLLQTLIFLKQRSVEETSAAQDGAHEDAFRDWAWRALTTISNAEFASIVRDRVVSVLTLL